MSGSKRDPQIFFGVLALPRFAAGVGNGQLAAGIKDYSIPKPLPCMNAYLSSDCYA